LRSFTSSASRSISRQTSSPDPAWSSRAQLASANSDVSRYGALVDKNYVTSQQMEQVKTTAAMLKATLASDQAAAQQAREAGWDW